MASALLRRIRILALTALPLAKATYRTYSLSALDTSLPQKRPCGRAWTVMATADARPKFTIFYREEGHTPKYICYDAPSANITFDWHELPGRERKARFAWYNLGNKPGERSCSDKLKKDLPACDLHLDKVGIGGDLGFILFGEKNDMLFLGKHQAALNF